MSNEREGRRGDELDEDLTEPFVESLSGDPDTWADLGSRGPRPPAEGVRIIGAEEAAAAIESGQATPRVPEDVPRFGDVPPAPEGPRPPLRFPGADPSSVEKPPVVAPPDSGHISLPHWTEPPTGEVPRFVGSSGDEAAHGRQEPEDDLTAWSTLDKGPRWRDSASDWDEGDFAAQVLQDEGSRVGALRGSDDVDELDEELAPDLFADQVARAEPPRSRRSSARTRRPEAGRGDAGRGGDLSARVLTGLGAAAVLLVAAFIGPAALVALTTLALVAGAAELFAALRSRGYQPATLLGVVATGSMVGAAYWRGEAAFPLVVSLVVVFSLLWYLTGVVRARPTMNVAVTLLAFLYVGFLGSFAALLLRHPGGEGTGVLLGAVVATVAHDVGSYFSGRWQGRTPLAASISPNKTVEGLIGGSLVTLVVCLLVVRGISPWDGASAFWLGLVVAVAAPLGDLCESMIKRDLDVKDMGNILPGHGGVLDRIDALLFVIPATYHLVRMLDLV